MTEEMEKIVEEMIMAFLDWFKEPMPDYCDSARWKWATFKEEAIKFKKSCKKINEN